MTHVLALEQGLLILAGVTQPMLCCWFHYCVLCMLVHAALFLYVAITFWAYRTAFINVLIGGIVRVKVIFTTVEIYLRPYCQTFHNLMLQSLLSKVWVCFFLKFVRL